jgi:aspartate 4-decarboxylase
MPKYKRTLTKNPRPKQTGGTRKNRVKKLSKKLFNEYDKLSPFALKDKLIKLASKKGPANLLNVGRGNPNFFNSFCRKIFAKLQMLCLDLSKPLMQDLVVYPNKNDYDFGKAIRSGCDKWPKREKEFLNDYLDFLKMKTSKYPTLEKNFIFHDVVLSTLGCFYPSPPQIQPHLSLICDDFLYDLVMGGRHEKQEKLEGASMKPSDFESFATEGGAAGILYVFNTLKENYLLNPGDSIAIVTPIFSPYLEMPRLLDYQLNIVELKGDPNLNFSLDDKEINKLKDKKIKALFMVNPTNPGAYSLSKDNIMKIGNIVNTERQDLIVLSDNVYAPFADQYNSFMLSCPRNTIEIFSLSKYFGTTGWRLGLVMIAKENRFNKLLTGLSSKRKDALDKRYEVAALEPRKLTFMERVVYDSRQVAEAHVGGLSTPQQVLTGLFLYYDMHDTSDMYSAQIKRELKDRIKLLYGDLETSPHIEPKSTDYYSLMYIPDITNNLYGEKAREHLMKKYEYVEFLFHLASKYQIVLLPGSGFGANKWSLRASLANLDAPSYKKISVGIKNCIKDFVYPVL